MKGYHGEQEVKGGFYLKHSTWEVEPVARGGGILPGDEEVRYTRLPLPTVMVAGPLAGLVFLIFLPFVGIIGITGFLAYKAVNWALAVAPKVAENIGKPK